jgi:hypothetical protein
VFLETSLVQGFSAYRRNALKISHENFWDTPVVMRLGVPIFKSMLGAIQKSCSIKGAVG